MVLSCQGQPVPAAQPETEPSLACLNAGNVLACKEAYTATVGIHQLVVSICPWQSRHMFRAPTQVAFSRPSPAPTCRAAGAPLLRRGLQAAAAPRTPKSTPLCREVAFPGSVLAGALQRQSKQSGGAACGCSTAARFGSLDDPSWQPSPTAGQRCEHSHCCTHMSPPPLTGHPRNTSTGTAAAITVEVFRRRLLDTCRCSRQFLQELNQSSLRLS